MLDAKKFKNNNRVYCLWHNKNKTMCVSLINNSKTLGQVKRRHTHPLKTGHHPTIWPYYISVSWCLSGHGSSTVKCVQ